MNLDDALRNWNLWPQHLQLLFLYHWCPRAEAAPWDFIGIENRQIEIIRQVWFLNFSQLQSISSSFHQWSVPLLLAMTDAVDDLFSSDTEDGWAVLNWCVLMSEWFHGELGTKHGKFTRKSGDLDPRSLPWQDEETAELKTQKKIEAAATHKEDHGGWDANVENGLPWSLARLLEKTTGTTVGQLVFYVGWWGLQTTNTTRGYYFVSPCSPL